MLSFFSRIVGILLVAVALVTAVIDGTKSIAESHFVATALGEHWRVFFPESLEAMRMSIEEQASWLWDPIAQWILSLPTWAVAGVLGVLLVWAGNRRPRRAFHTP